jgi:hypothetical protein
MLDLYNNTYDRKTLKDNIYNVKLMDIVKTQKLDITFIVRYILSDLYQLREDEMNITIDDIMKYQPRLNRKALEIALSDYNSDDDSVEDFESVSLK